MSKRFLLVVLGTIAFGLALGAFLASVTAPPSPAATSAGALKGGLGASQGQSGGRTATTGDPALPAAQGDATGRSANQGVRPIMGSIVSRDGDTLTVNTQQGDVKVGIAETKIQKTVDGSADDLKPGLRVTVTGQRGEDGNYTASAIQIMPEGERPGAAGAAPGGGVGTGRAERGATPVPTRVAR